MTPFQKEINCQLIVVFDYLSQNSNTLFWSKLKEEHLWLLSKNIALWLSQEVPQQLPPHFSEEILVDTLSLRTQLRRIQPQNDRLSAWVAFFEKLSLKEFWILMGQRLTSASIHDERALPPSPHLLVQSAFKAYNSETTVAVRAWEKHVGRYPNSILGTIQGNQKDKEQKVRTLFTYIWEQQTWWNVFYHYKHQYVYEIRVSNGQGLRWNKDGTVFIGFLEAFLEE